MLAPVTHLVDIMSKMTSKRLVDRLDRDGVMAHRFMTVDSVPPWCFCAALGLLSDLCGACLEERWGMDCGPLDCLLHVLFLLRDH